MEKGRAAFLAKAEAFYAEAMAWRGEHKGASFDEMVRVVRPGRRELMGELLRQLALAEGNGAVAEGQRCEQCGEEMRNKGELKREVLNGEGDSSLARAHYYCPRCQSGFFPPGQGTQTGEA